MWLKTLKDQKSQQVYAQMDNKKKQNMTQNDHINKEWAFAATNWSMEKSISSAWGWVATGGSTERSGRLGVITPLMEPYGLQNKQKQPSPPPF